MSPATHAAAELEACAHICHDCQDACLRLIPHCLGLGGAHASPDHIGMLLDCIAICEASRNLLHRQSPMHRETCRACAAICTACAKDCEDLAGGDQAMLACAEECHRCADSCRHMSG